ncbi:hypothetical protein FF011L_06590 [Roseimaritima multifibrata]|uniref:Uncharacterized protein n=1 Tax=Roseimaritima multifibrata TaxID=1930274 RepID=A0A517MAK7_9BACT|nr:hypothetical protein FF011L_06590 [Roseimaritima multifibrata]
MPGVTNRSDPPHKRPTTKRLENWVRPLPAGHWGAVRVRVSWSLVLTCLAVLVGGWWFGSRPGDGDLPVLAGIVAAAIVGSACFQAALRVWIAKAFGVTPAEVSLHALGGWGVINAPALLRLQLGIAIPALTMCLAVGLAVMPPHGIGWQGISLLPPELTGNLNAAAVLIACIWVLTIHATAQTLPLLGCHGREALIAVVDLFVQRHPTWSRTRTVRQTLGIFAIFWIMAGLFMLLWQFTSAADTTAVSQPIASWPWPIFIGIACWAGRRAPLPANISHTLLACPADPGNGSKPLETLGDLSKEVSIRQSWQDWKNRRKLQAAHEEEILEAVDADRLDEILDRLQQTSYSQLPKEDRKVLDRISQRLRKSNGGHVSKK